MNAVGRVLPPGLRSKLEWLRSLLGTEQLRAELRKLRSTGLSRGQAIVRLYHDKRVLSRARKVEAPVTVASPFGHPIHPAHPAHPSWSRGQHRGTIGLGAWWPWSADERIYTDLKATKDAENRIAAMGQYKVIIMYGTLGDQNKSIPAETQQGLLSEAKTAVDSLVSKGMIASEFGEALKDLWKAGYAARLSWATGATDEIKSATRAINEFSGLGAAYRKAMQAVGQSIAQDAKDAEAAIARWDVAWKALGGGLVDRFMEKLSEFRTKYADFKRQMADAKTKLTPDKYAKLEAEINPYMTKLKPLLETIDKGASLLGAKPVSSGLGIAPIAIGTGAVVAIVAIAAGLAILSICFSIIAKHIPKAGINMLAIGVGVILVGAGVLYLSKAGAGFKGLFGGAKK